MRFKDLTEVDIKKINDIYWNKDLKWDIRMKMLMDFTGKSERTVRKWCSEKLNIKQKIDAVPKQIELAKTREHDKTKKRYLITSAQNATKINKELWLNMKSYAKYINAEILVIPFRYFNPSLYKKQDRDYWDKDLVPHLTLKRLKLNNSLQILGDVKIQPTAYSPLMGLEGMTGDYSCIVGHPKMELKTVPVLDEYKPKLMLTTGCCTIPNFSDTKAGKKGEFHYSSGFSIVEIKDDDNFFVRQVSSKSTGEFIDLNTLVKKQKISKVNHVEALIWGDIHVHSCNSEITDITLNNLCKKLKPKEMFIHDIMDSYSISHHKIKDPFMQYEMEMNGSNSLKDEVDEMLLWLEQIKDYSVNIVESNHDEHIDRFLRETDWRKMSTPKNSLTYMKYATAILEGKAKDGVIPYIIKKRFPKFKCLTKNDSVIIKGYLCSMHGHQGASGSRGSMTQFSKLSVKNVVGHTHSPSRVSGSCCVGTSTHLRLDYNDGLTSWMNAHGIINELGKFQHILFFKTKDGYEYTTLM